MLYLSDSVDVYHWPQVAFVSSCVSWAPFLDTTATLKVITYGRIQVKPLAADGQYKRHKDGVEKQLAVRAEL